MSKGKLPVDFKFNEEITKYLVYKLEHNNVFTSLNLSCMIINWNNDPKFLWCTHVASVLFFAIIILQKSKKDINFLFDIEPLPESEEEEEESFHNDEKQQQQEEINSESSKESETLLFPRIHWTFETNPYLNAAIENFIVALDDELITGDDILDPENFGYSNEGEIDLFYILDRAVQTMLMKAKETVNVGHSLNANFMTSNMLEPYFELANNESLKIQLDYKSKYVATLTVILKVWASINIEGLDEFPNEKDYYFDHFVGLKEEFQKLPQWAQRCSNVVNVLQDIVTHGWEDPRLDYILKYAQDPPKELAPKAADRRQVLKDLYEEDCFGFNEEKELEGFTNDIIDQADEFSEFELTLRLRLQRLKTIRRYQQSINLAQYFNLKDEETHVLLLLNRTEDALDLLKSEISLESIDINCLKQVKRQFDTVSNEDFQFDENNCLLGSVLTLYLLSLKGDESSFKSFIEIAFNIEQVTKLSKEASKAADSNKTPLKVICDQQSWISFARFSINELKSKFLSLPKLIQLLMIPSLLVSIVNYRPR